MFKRLLVLILGAVLLLVAALIGTFASMSYHTRAIVDRADLGGVEVVADGYVAAYIVDVAADQVALVDCLDEADGGKLKAALGDRGLGPEQVVAIFLTHGHIDHVSGCVDFPKAAVFALEAEVPIIEGREASKGPIQRLMGAQDIGLRVGNPVRDGDVVSLGEISARVYAVPGHTVGSAAWLIRDVLFMGDAASQDRDGTLQGTPWIVSDDSSLNYSSLGALAERLKAEGTSPKFLAFGHSAHREGVQPLYDLVSKAGR